MTQLKTIAFAKFQATLFCFIGMVAGIIYSFGGLLIDSLSSLGWMTAAESPGLSIGTLLAFGALIGMPLLFALAGFICGIFEATLFNFCSKHFGPFKTNIFQD